MKINRLFSPSQQKGQHFENLALRYLKSNGLRLINKNYSCSCGEIDLILKDKDVIVFVEVRFRKNSSHGSAVDSITFTKQQKIIKTAKIFLLQYGLYDKVPCRFDVIGLTMLNKQVDYSWIKNAFQ